MNDFTEQARQLVLNWLLDNELFGVGERESDNLAERVASFAAEAATAALEQAAQVVRERRKWYDESLFGFMPSAEEVNNMSESEQRLIMLAGANMARRTCDHLLTEIAAIGDDKGSSSDDE